MRSDYKRLALSLLDKFKDYEQVRFSVGVVWGRGETIYCYGILVDWHEPTYDLDVHGIFHHTATEEEAHEVLRAIERQQSLLSPRAQRAGRGTTSHVD